MVLDNNSKKTQPASEIKTIIKSLFKTPPQQDSYHQLTRSNYNVGGILLCFSTGAHQG
jgi:hypothetical protein